MVKDVNFISQKAALLRLIKGYMDYEWFANLTKQGVFFVTRLRYAAMRFYSHKELLSQSCARDIS